MKYKIIKSTCCEDTSMYEHPVSDSVKEPSILLQIGDNRLIELAGEISLCSKQNQAIWEKSFYISGQAAKAYISDDRILLLTRTKHYHAWGTLGPAFIINLLDGTLVKKLIGESGVALSGGRFLLGLEGYENFDTWLYDKNGQKIQAWRSYGHYIISKNDDIRILECDRIRPTSSRLVALKLDGQISEISSLNESPSGKPIVLPNSALVFLDCGVLRIFDNHDVEQVNLRLMDIPPDDLARFHWRIDFNEGALDINIYQREKNTPYQCFVHHWIIAIS